MPIYVYRAKKGPRDVVEGELPAETQAAAFRKLEAMSLSPLQIAEKNALGADTAFTPADMRPLLHRVKTDDVNAFSWQLASMTRAGVPILQALSLLAGQSGSAGLKQMLTIMERDIRGGKMFSESLRRFPRSFNNLYVSLVRAGEKSGALDKVLFELAEHLQKQQEIRRRIQAALAYPLFMVAAGVATVLIVLMFFMPKLTGLFQDMGQDLPWATQALMGISNLLVEHWFWLVIMAGFIMMLVARMKPGSKSKYVVDVVKLRLHFINRIVRHAEIARFAQTLGLLLENGIPIFESFELAAETLDNEVLRDQLRRAGKVMVNQGSTLSASLANKDVMPEFAVNMLAVGEKSGHLEQSLAEIVRTYEKEGEQALRLMMALMEPVLILLVGGMVGFIVFAMLMPIFNMGAMAH